MGNKEGQGVTKRTLDMKAERRLGRRELKGENSEPEIRGNEEEALRKHTLSLMPYLILMFANLKRKGILKIGEHDSVKRN